MIPTPHTVQVRRLVAGGEDAHGDTTTTYGDPAPLLVHYVVPAQSVEPYRQNRDLLLTDKVVSAPKSNALPGARDQIVWDGEDYTVEGDVADFTVGPWSAPFAGVTFLIRRVEG